MALWDHVRNGRLILHGRAGTQHISRGVTGPHFCAKSWPAAIQQ